MKAKELLRRYCTGERDFKEVDLSGESLQGMNLTGIDLSGANLSQTDLLGTKLTDAKLMGTQLCEAKTGSQWRWRIPIILLSLALTGLVSSLLGSCVGLFLGTIMSSSGRPPDVVTRNVVLGIIGLVFIAATFYFNYRRGILATLGAVVVAFTVAVIVTATFASAGAGTVASAVAFAFAVAFAVAFVVAFAVAFVVAFAGTFAVFFTGIFFAIPVAVAVAFAVGAADSASRTLNVSDKPLLLWLTIVIVLLITGLNWVISRRALSGDPRDKLIRDMAVGLASLGGTRFDGADLTDANFSKAIVKSAHFNKATFRRTCFHLAQQLHLSRAYTTPLANRTALNLLVSLRPEPNKSYVGLNLKGANLANANLADLDLTETDLSDATLKGADLQRTMLIKLQALGTNFHQANLTAACIESWNIDSTTQLAGALCEHVYLLRNQQERRPNSGMFEPDEFSELFKEVLNTIDLIFRDGMDWLAFMQTFKTLQVEYQGADLDIQSMEKKGNGVMVVRLDTHPDADKPAIHQAFKQNYERQLAAVEQEYKVLLQSKDQALAQKEELIELHRQKGADMTRIAESLAQRPVTVEVTATADSKTGDDTINIQGDANNSTVRIGDTLGDLESKGDSREQAREADD